MILTLIRAWFATRLARCANCRAWRGVRWEPSRTAYYWNGSGPNPNRAQPYCRPCAQEHHQYWDDMWAEYYSGRL